MPEKLKVLIITERFYPEEFLINDLAVEWGARNIQVDVLTQAPSYPFGKILPGYANWPLSRQVWNGINILRFYTVTGYQRSLLLKLLNYISFAVAGSLVALFTARKYDRIFVYHTGPLTLAIPAVLAAKLYGKDLTIWTQDVWPDTVYAYGFKRTRVLSAILDRLVAFIYTNCDRIFVTCEGFREKISPYAAGKPIYHFPNWSTIAADSQPAGGGIVLSSRFNFTFAGNIGKVQNLENVLRGFALAVKDNSGIQLNLVGDGSHLETLKAIVETEKIPNVVFWGRKRQSEMPAYLAASDVLIVSLDDSPVFNLTVPAKFQAYLAFGKPIFCVMNGEVRRLVEQHGVGLCAAPGDLAGIKDGFIRFCGLSKDELAAYKGKSLLLAEVYDRGRIIDSMTKLMAG